MFRISFYSKLFASLLIGSALVLTGCGESPGACNSETGHFCIMYEGHDYDEAGVQADCDTITGGVYQKDDCPEDGIVGRCIIDEEEPTEREYIYYEDDDFDATAAEDACTLLEGNLKPNKAVLFGAAGAAVTSLVAAVFLVLPKSFSPTYRHFKPFTAHLKKSGYTVTDRGPAGGMAAGIYGAAAGRRYDIDGNKNVFCYLFNHEKAWKEMDTKQDQLFSNFKKGSDRAESKRTIKTWDNIKCFF